MNKSLQNKVNLGKALPLMEAFYTIQGEGYHKGSAAYFIRIGGCDVGCHWCDVKESWDAQKHPATLIEKIVEQAIKYSNIIVLTGGEPLMWNMEHLTLALKKKKMQIHIETSGAHSFSGNWDWFTLSPKKRKQPKLENYLKADELKVVIARPNDFVFAEEQAIKVSSTCKLYLQPEWSKESEIIENIIAYVKENPRWNISLQTHKYMDIPKYERLNHNVHGSK